MPRGAHLTGSSVRRSTRGRPGLRRLVGVALLATLGLLPACGSANVRVDAPAPAAREADRCRALVADLPQWLGQAARRAVEPSDALAAAWGDPPIVLRCGVDRPPALRPSSPCVEIEGVGWFAERAERGYVFTTVGREVYVEVAVPSTYRPESDQLVALAEPIDAHDPVVTPCA